MRPQRRRTIGDNPLDAVIPPRLGSPADEPAQRPGRSLAVGIAFDPAVLERARNAVYWTPGLTLTALANLGVSRVVDELERDNHGRPFPARDGTVRTGRPLKPPVASLLGGDPGHGT